MQFTTRKENDVLIAGLAGRMDAVTAPDFDRQFKEWFSGGANLFVFNLSELQYISSAGLRSILAAAKQLKEKSFLRGLRDPSRRFLNFQASTRSSRSAIPRSRQSAA